MGHKQILFAYLLLVNIFPSHDWFICLRFSLILIYATLFKWANYYSNSALKDLRKLMDLPRAGENMCALWCLIDIPLEHWLIFQIFCSHNILIMTPRLLHLGRNSIQHKLLRYTHFVQMNIKTKLKNQRSINLREFSNLPTHSKPPPTLLIRFWWFFHVLQLFPANLLPFY